MAQVFEAIHNDSCMCGKSQLDLFTVPNTQVLQDTQNVQHVWCRGRNTRT